MTNATQSQEYSRCLIHVLSSLSPPLSVLFLMVPIQTCFCIMWKLGYKYYYVLISHHLFKTSDSQLGNDFALHGTFVKVWRHF